jgi:hypothetical protein
MTLRGSGCCDQREASCTPHCIEAVGRTDWLATLDSGIAPYVDVLDAAGIETYESCEGGRERGHSYPEPAIRFHGDSAEGFRALAAAVQHGLPVRAIRRFWQVDRRGEPHGPYWEIAFWEAATPDECSRRSVDDHPDRASDAKT